jgi:hypothetical protein
VSDHVPGSAYTPEHATPDDRSAAFLGGSRHDSPHIFEEFRAYNADQLAPEIIIKLAQQEHIYSRLGLLVGAAAFGGGLAMIVVTHSTGSVDLLIQYGSVQIHIITVVIGVVIALFGIGIILITRPNIKLVGTDSGGIEAVNNRTALRDARPGRMRREGRVAEGRPVRLRWRSWLTRNGNLNTRQDESGSISRSPAVQACGVWLSAIEATGYDKLRPPEEVKDWQSYARDRDEMIDALAGGVVTLLTLVTARAPEAEAES